MARTQKRTGRPTKPPQPDQRVQLSMRVRADVKMRLDEAAERNGRSQSQEAELLIERGLLEEDQFGGPEILAMARLMATAFERGGRAGARSRNHPRWSVARWLQDPWCYVIACKRVGLALDAVAPEPRKFREGTSEEQKALSLKISDFFAAYEARRTYLEEIQEGDAS